MHYIGHFIRLQSCVQNYRLCRVLVFMNVRYSVFLKSYRVDSETNEGVLIYPSRRCLGIEWSVD